MSAIVVRVVILPRFTTLVGPDTGTTEFVSTPFNARAFSSADIVLWRGENAGGSFSFVLEQSTDLLTWSTLATLDVPSVGGEAVTPVQFVLDWVRLRAAFTDGARLTSWVVGDFTERTG